MRFAFRQRNRPIERATAISAQGKYREALAGIAELRPAVDHFFEDVMVMAENEEVRRNRLTLLADLLTRIFDHCGFFRDR